jgi:hypothetical protein
MNATIRNEADVQTLLQTVGIEVPLYGADGQLLGYFTPARRPGMNFPEFGMTDEEMEQLRNDPNAKWVTGEEVMARLRDLRKGK